MQEERSSPYNRSAIKVLEVTLTTMILLRKCGFIVKLDLINTISSGNV